MKEDRLRELKEDCETMILGGAISDREIKIAIHGVIDAAFALGQSENKECQHKWVVEEIPQLYYRKFRTCSKCGKSEEVTLPEYSENKWVSVEDRLPEEDTYVLVYIPTYYSKFTVALYSYKVYSKFGWFTNTVTHWRNLPEPPKGGE